MLKPVSSLTYKYDQIGRYLSGCKATKKENMFDHLTMIQPSKLLFFWTKKRHETYANMPWIAETHVWPNISEAGSVKIRAVWISEEK